jgi:oligosaccharide 4-alpha-D-glucosyltransferase
MRKIVSKLILLSILSLFLGLATIAQNASREYVGYKQNIGEIIVNVSDGHYKIIEFNKKAFQVTFYPENHEVKNFSYAVATTPEKPSFLIKDESNTLKIESKELKVYITKKPFNISFYRYADLLFSENEGYSLSDSTQKMNFKIEDSEVLYGGGARVLGMNRRGYDLEMYNKAHYGYTTHSELMNFTLPMYISSKKYAVLFDNASIGHLDLDSKKNNTIEYETVSGTMNYFVICGRDWFDLNDQITKLTGRQPLPPRWAFGNFSSRFGYHSQKEVEAAIIDIYWFGKEIMGTMGNLEWDKDRFPDPGAMIAKLNKQGVKTILVTEPFILTTSSKWQDAVDNKVLGTDSVGNPYTYDFYFGNTGLVDIFKPEAKEWFWEFYKDLTTQGIGGWWGDLGEPEVHPTGLQHVNGSADEVHNAYGHEWAKMVFEGYKKDFPTQRPFILMRAGFAGSQRYGMIPWTGDVSQSWGGLVPQPEIALQMGMQGLAYMHSDLGGFAVADTTKPIDNELYTRWLQYGVFQPIYRPHAQEQIPAEPVYQIETTKAHAKTAIELRYKMLPYIYSLAFENNQTGKPLMYPLFYVEPKNGDLLTYDEAYMWGDAFLVSPVKEQGKKSQKVYLPKGNGWTNFYTNKIHEGGQEIETPLTMDNIPVFVKGGEFLPLLTEAKQTKNYSIANFDMHFYADQKVRSSTYTLYNDDGNTPNAYEKGMYEVLNFEAKNSEKLLTIKALRSNGKKFTKTEDNLITFIIHNLNKKPKKVMVNGKKYPDKVIYEEVNKTATFTTIIRKYEKIIELRY